MVAAEHTDFPDDLDNRDDASFVQRLRAAVEAAGGPTLVAKQSGVPLRNLTHYLGGREMKRPSLVAVAKTCNVSISWLACGEGHMRDHTAAAQAATAQNAASAPGTLFSSINMDLLAAAMEGAFRSAAENKVSPNDWSTRARITCLLYDAAMQEL